jgi:hypothetical protein
MDAEEQIGFRPLLADFIPFIRTHVVFAPTGLSFVAEPLEGIEPVSEGELVRQASRAMTCRLISNPDALLHWKTPLLRPNNPDQQPRRLARL